MKYVSFILIFFSSISGFSQVCDPAVEGSFVSSSVGLFYYHTASETDIDVIKFATTTSSSITSFNYSVSGTDVITLTGPVSAIGGSTYDLIKDGSPWVPSIGTHTVELTATCASSTIVYQLFITVIENTSSSPCVSSAPEGVSIIGGSTVEKWDKMTFKLVTPIVASEDGPASEPSFNVFMDYRIDVALRPNSSPDWTYIVPAYYAADGEAGETGSACGNVWNAHFTPDQLNLWRYEISVYRTSPLGLANSQHANLIKSQADLSAAITAGYVTQLIYPGLKGDFQVTPNSFIAPDNRAKGRMIYDDKRYPIYKETGDIAVTVGVGSPENFLAYNGFDNTYVMDDDPDITGNFFELRETLSNNTSFLHEFDAHSLTAPVSVPDCSWCDNQNILGALEYLASEDMSTLYVIPMTRLGDGNDAWPWVEPDQRLIYDCSKLDQWQRVFDYANNLGFNIHMLLFEEENESLLDGGTLGIERKLYYKEMAARFGHLLNITWNMGEELSYDAADGAGVPRTPTGVIEEIDYLASIDAYESPILVHNWQTSDIENDLSDLLDPLVDTQLKGVSLQLGGAGNNDPNHLVTFDWQDREKDGDAIPDTYDPWLVSLDEPADEGAYQDASNTNQIRKKYLWSALTAGAWRVQLYFGRPQDGDHSDLDCEDFTLREPFYADARQMLSIAEDLPLESMSPNSDLVGNSGLPDVLAPNSKQALCLADPGYVYLVYLQDVNEFMDTKPFEILLPDEDAEYSVEYFNVIEGGTPSSDGGDENIMTVSTGGSIPLSHLIPDPLGSCCCDLSCSVPISCPFVSNCITSSGGLWQGSSTKDIAIIIKNKDTYCEQPKNLNAVVNPGGTTATLSWESNGSGEYKVTWRQIGVSDYTDFSIIESIATPAGVTIDYFATGLAPGSTYEWRLTGICGMRNSVPSEFNVFPPLAPKLDGHAEAESKKLKIWPNPANDYVNVLLNCTEINHRIYVYDIQGKEVHNSIATGQLTQIDCHSWKGGLYVIVTRNNQTGEEVVSKLSIAK